MRSILITGVSGVGKTTVSRRTAETLGLKNWDYADLMLRVAPEFDHQDQLQTLSPGRRDRIYREVETLLAELFEPGDRGPECVLLENHLSIVEEGRIRTFPHSDCRRYNAVALVVVEADPARIMQWRQADPHRARNLGSVEQVLLQQACNRQEADLIAAYLKIPMTVIANDRVDRSSEHLTAWLREVVP